MAARMNRFRLPALAIGVVAAVLCTGCPAMLIATGATTAASILADNRSMAQQASDLQTKAAVEQALASRSATLAGEVNVDVFLGRVMLTGVVDSAGARWKATEAARGAAGGAEVFDDITIGDPSLDQTAANVAANKALAVNLLAQEGIASQSLLHRVVNGTAFVMGEVQAERQVRVIRETALSTTGVSYVVTHITLEQD
jgi:osmotically-inducible protein OsmY